MSIESSTKILREAAKHSPLAAYAWGVVGVAAASGLVISLIGADLSAIRTWLLVFLATVLVAVFAQGLRGGPGKSGLPGQLLIWAVLVAFLIFLCASASAVMGYGPAALERFWSIDSNPSSRVSNFETPPNGPVNFGCTQGATITLSYSAPPGYIILNAQSVPVDARGTKFISPEGSISPNKSNFSGRVYFHGKDRDWTGNCPGGGHGKAKIVGQLIRESELSAFPAFPVFLLVAVGFVISLMLVVQNKRGRRAGSY